MNRDIMRIISFLLRKRNCKQKALEPTPQKLASENNSNNNNSTTSLPADSMLHLSYPFYLLSRAPR
jgi:hypothetical protein